MHRVIVLFAVFLSVWVNSQDDSKKCSKIGDYESICCKDFEESDKKFKQDIIECFDIPISATSCEHEACIAGKMGILKDNNEIDYVALENKMADHLGEDVTLLNIFKDKCFYNDLTGYAAEGACLLKKFTNCLAAQRALNCKSWQSSEVCAEKKEVAEECANM